MEIFGAKYFWREVQTLDFKGDVQMLQSVKSAKWTAGDKLTGSHAVILDSINWKNDKIKSWKYISSFFASLGEWNQLYKQFWLPSWLDLFSRYTDFIDCHFNINSEYSNRSLFLIMNWTRNSQAGRALVHLGLLIPVTRFASIPEFAPTFWWPNLNVDDLCVAISEYPSSQHCINFYIFLCYGFSGNRARWRFRNMAYIFVQNGISPHILTYAIFIYYHKIAQLTSQAMFLDYSRNYARRRFQKFTDKG